MRIGAITGSIVFHVALIAAAYTLPPSAPRTVAEPVTIDLYEKEQAPEAKVAPKPEPPIELPKPEPPKLQPKVDPKVAKTEPEHETPQPETPPKVEPPSGGAPPEANPGKKDPGKVDLTLHALPSGSDNAVTIPDGPGTLGGQLGSNTPGIKKPWHVDAGNPLIGKLDEVKEDRYPLTPVAGGEYVYKGKAFSARISRDGRVSFDDKSIRDFKGLSGGFDVTDMLMRAHHNDPYRVEKEHFMEHTDKLRKKLMADAQKEKIASSLLQLPAHLDEIWHGSGTPAARRKLIYEFWLDCELADSDASRQATAVIETYVRRYLPDGTDSAFSEDELERLNRGKKEKFAPYR